MRTAKKLMALLAAAAMTASLAACGGGIQKADETTTAAAADGETTEAAAEGEETEAAAASSEGIIIGSSMTYTTSDPACCYDGDLIMVLRAAYDTLVMTDEDETTIIPGIAESWTVSDDSLVYTFELRDDVVFTTGKTCTAEDVAYCLNRLAGIQQTPSFLLDGVESVEATGDYEVTLTLAAPNPAILTILTESMFGIYDSDVAKANGGSCDENDTFGTWCDSNPSIGSGPMQITNYESSNLMVLEKYDGCVTRTAASDKITIMNVPDATTQQMDLEGGDIDFALDLSNDQINLLDGTDGLQKITSSTTDIFFLLFNRDEEIGGPLADPLVEEAIGKAIDFEGLLTLCPEGTLVPNGIIQSGFLGYAGDRDTTRDVDGAKALLEEAGYADGFEFTLTTVSDMAVDGVTFTILAEKIAADLAEVGITCNVNAEAVSVYLEGYRDGTEQAVLAEWSPDYPDAVNQLAFCPGYTVGLRAHWDAEDNQELADLAAAASSELDDDKRADMLVQIQEMMQEDSPFIVLCQAGRAWEASDKIQNVITSSSYYMDLASLTKSAE